VTSLAPSATPRRAPRRIVGGRRSVVVAALLAALVVAGCKDKAPPAGTDPNTATTVAGAISGADPGATVAAVGTTLFEAPTYTVVAGDTIGKIATKLGVPVQTLIDANGIAKPDKIQVGQKLRVPSGAAAAATTTTAG
jgi:LysM repeat protein